jgi:fructokinase
MRKTILAYGEVLWDLLPDGPLLGGAPLNFAYRVNCLGDRGIMASRLGRDELGRNARRTMAELGMDTRLMQDDADRPTGTVPVTLDERGNPDFVIIANVAYDYIEPAAELLESARQADCICFGTLIQRTATSRRTLGQVLDAGAGVLKLLDINFRRDCYTPETILHSLVRADVLKCNDDEATELAAMFDMGDVGVASFCDLAMARWSLRACVVTLGERGAFATSPDGERVYCPGYACEVVDTCGAGDAFTAGFACRLLRGRSLGDCCQLGNAVGAMVASQRGATTPITPEQVERFLANARTRTSEPSLERFING